MLERHPLKGTPKQKEWAQIIRTKKAQQLEKLGLSGILKLIRPQLDSEKLEQMGCTTQRNMRLLGWWVCEIAIREQESSWWIKSRDENPEQWIRETAKTQIQEWIKTKPF